MEREKLHYSERAIAQLTAIYANSQKGKPPYFKPSDFYVFPIESSTPITANTCATFLSLSRENLLPGWILNLAPIEDIQKNTGGSVVRPRLWMSRQIALFAPKFKNDIFVAGLVVGNGVSPGKIEVWDIDSGESHFVWVPFLEESYLIEVQWPVVPVSAPLPDMPTLL